MASYKGPLDYIDVATRIIEFREKYPTGSLQSWKDPYVIEVKMPDGSIKSYMVYSAAAYRSPDDTLPGVGWAYEPIPGPTNFTRDSELQNAETAAWGRAMVAALAVDTKKGIASSEEVRNRQTKTTDAPAAKAPAPESLTELGASIVEVFNSLKLDDPRLEIWTQVNASIEKISEKINEQKFLEQKLHEVAIDIENLRNLTAEFVNHAYQNEVEIHATSKVRVQIAESLNQRIKNALKT